MTDDIRLSELGQFTPEGNLTPGYGETYIFHVGRDDVHGILHFIIPSELFFFKGNMFGYDDEQLNQDIIDKFKNPAIHVQMTLDKRQEAGVHERKIIELDKQLDPIDFSNSFAIGNSATGDIDHTKGGVLVGQGMAFEGSTNWSASGEGIGISLKADVKNPAGFHAQNNTLVVTTNSVFISRFSAELDIEHKIALQQMQKGVAK